MTHAQVQYAHVYAAPKCAYLGGRPAPPKRLEGALTLPAWKSGPATHMEVGSYKGYLIVSCVAASGHFVGFVIVPPKAR
jgi:hypothetical protein